MPFYLSNTGKKAPGGKGAAWSPLEIKKLLAYMEKKKEDIEDGEELSGVKGFNFWNELCDEPDFGRSAGACATFIKKYMKTLTPAKNSRLLMKGMFTYFRLVFLIKV